MKWKSFISTVLVCVLMAVTFIPASAQSGEVPIWIQQDGVYQGANGTSYDQDYIDEILDEDGGYYNEDGEYEDSVEIATASNVSTASNWNIASGSNWATASNAFETVVYTEAGPFMPAIYVGGTRKLLSRAQRNALAENAETDTSSLHLKKMATGPDKDGKYTITLESYTTGTVTTVTKREPVDIVLVLDQSGSMAYSFGNTTRQAAMKTAVKNFIEAVGDQYNAETSDHRIALVTFGSGASTLQDWTYVDVKGQNDLIGSIDGLGRWPNGATKVDLGMEQAKSLFDEDYAGENKKRQQVVIVFTDGMPTSSSTFDTKVASDSIQVAKKLKDDGITVYSIGIFKGANPGQTYGDSEFDQTSNGEVGSHWAEETGWGQKDYDIPAGNRFLNYLSSNSKTANEIGLEEYKGSEGNWWNEKDYIGWKITQNFDCNVTAGYYLTANDSDSLNNVFKSISQNISSANTALDSSTVVKDVVSPYFEIPEGAEIKTYTANYVGKDNVGKDKFDERKPVGEANDIRVDKTGDNTIQVTGFDYYKNFVSESGRDETDPNNTGDFRGRKLIIEFTVQPKPGFLGGDDVPTNDASSGFYLKENDSEPLKPFDVPKVSVPIPSVLVTAEDKNVYLMGSLTKENIKDGLKVSAGENNEITIDLSKPNYGLEDWQYKFVDITAGQKPNDTPLNNLTEDQTYTAQVTITSKTETSNSSQGEDEANIYVFKPVFTFKDGEGFYGDVVPGTEYMDKLRTGLVQWKHDGKEYATDQMTGTEPTGFQFDYAPKAALVQGGTIATKQDLPVTVTSVKLPGTGDNRNLIGFCVIERSKCIDKDDSDLMNGEGHFVLHIKTGQLTIKKSGGSANEPYVFTVKKDNVPYTQVSVMGNGEATIMELPKGTYTIEEDTAWSWRYNGETTGSAVISAESPNGELTCTNTPYSNKQKWLNGFSAVVQNVFGVNQTTRKAVR